MNKLLLVLLVIPLAANSCNNKKNNNCREVICTQIFASVNLKVTNKDGEPAKLTEHYTVNTKTSDTLTFEQGGWPEGSYTVVDDNYVSKMYNSTVEFRFIGMQGNVKVVDEPFTISADCCHISKISGKDTVTID